MRIVYESKNPFREGKRIEQAHKLERRKARERKANAHRLALANNFQGS